MAKELKALIKKANEESLKRSIAVNREAIDEESRTVEIAVSSEEPYGRYWGVEILDHTKESIDLTRMESGGAVLVDHNHSDIVGTIESVRLDSDRVLRAVVRFGRSERAREVFQDVVDGIRKHISVGYFIEKMVLEEETDENSTYRVTRWTPFEASFVSVPADPTVGVGRSKGEQPSDPEFNPKKVEVSTMTPEEKAALEAKQKQEREALIKAGDDKAKAAAQAERDRITEINNLGAEFNCVELAQKAIDDGIDPNEFARQALEAGGTRTVTAADDPNVGMDQKDLDKFSVLKLMRAISNPTDKAAQKAAGFELELSAAAAQKEKREARENGVIIPMDVLSSPVSRSMTVGTAINGGNLVAEELLSSSFIDVLRNVLVVQQLGATILTGLNGNIAIPRKTGGAAYYWLAENGEPTESNATFDQVLLKPKTIGAWTEISRLLMLQSSMDAEMLARAELLITLAEGIDETAIYGTGADNQPKGIANIAGIGSVDTTTNGKAPTWSDIVRLETEAGAVNALRGDPKYLTNAKVRGKLKETEKFAGGGREIWTGDAKPLNGYDALVSNMIKSDQTKGTGTNLSDILFGNFSDLLIGMWGGLDLTYNPYAKAKSGAVQINVLQSLDINVKHPESFVLGRGFITS